MDVTTSSCGCQLEHVVQKHMIMAGERGSIGCLRVTTYGRGTEGVFGGCVRQPVHRAFTNA